MVSEKDKFIEIFNSIDFQQIKNHPNILIAANFWEDERYQAAKVCYRFMRAIDDLIDNYKAENRIIASDKKKTFRENVKEWLKQVLSTSGNNLPHQELKETINRFRIPSWIMKDFAKSMIYDINYDGFPTLDAFLDYSKGATVAPASVFVHLAGLRKEKSTYKKPLFDVREVATPCAIFSYLVHIVRDFQKDQNNNLNYFAHDLLVKNDLTPSDLRDIASGKPVNDSFRNLIKEYYDLADLYRLKTVDVMNRIRPLIEPRYQLSFEIIFNLYVMVFDKIDLKNGTFTTKELNPEPEEIKEMVNRTILNFKRLV